MGGVRFGLAMTTFVAFFAVYAWVGQAVVERFP